MTRTAILAAAAMAAASILQAAIIAQESPETTTVEITSPAAGSEVSGLVEVSVKAVVPEGCRTPARVYAGFGGRPWKEMSSAGQADRWRVRMDSTMVPNGRQPVTVVSDDRHVRCESHVVVRNPMREFLADLHSHTSYSDGSLLPAIAYEYARRDAGLDVFSLTDHLESITDSEWDDIREQSWKANEDGEFVAVPGLEWTKRQGHTCIFDPKTRQWPVNTQEFYAAAARAGVVVKFNHPGDGSKVFDGLAYSEVGDRAVQMMEVRSADEEKAFIRALSLGWHIAPDGSDDTHGPNWGNCRSWTVILAPGLSCRNVLDALGNRRCYSTLDRNCSLRFEVNGETMGSILEEAVPDVEIAVEAADEDGGDRIARIELFENGTVICSDEPNCRTRDWRVRLEPDPGRYIYFAKVTQADDDMLWSAPVWLEVDRQ
jgi:hypothetical protein